MHPRVDRRPTIEAVRAAARRALLMVPLLATACSEVPRDFQPSYWWRNISGAYLDERQPPPGMNAPFPNLATVPARPVPPDAATRAGITAALAGDRAFARTDPAARAIPSGPPGLPAAPPDGAGPPPPPRLVAAPGIRLEAPRPVAPAAASAPEAPRAGPTPEAPRAAPAAPAAPPPAPLPELLGLPPAPSSDLLAPRIR